MKILKKTTDSRRAGLKGHPQCERVMESFHLLPTSEYLPWFEISAMWLFLRLSETALLRAMNNSSFFAYLFFSSTIFLTCLFLCFGFLFISVIFIFNLLSFIFFPSLLHLPKKLTFLPCFFSSSNPLRSPSQIQAHKFYGLTLSPSPCPHVSLFLTIFCSHNMRIEAAGSSEMLVPISRLSSVIFQKE